MLRNLALALVGLFLLAGPAAARDDGPAGGRRVEAKGYVGAKADRSSPLLRRAMATTVRPVALFAAMVPAACGGRASRAGGHHGTAPRCRTQVASWGGWAQGLPPALGIQAQECPFGTLATLAEGHEDVVRCILM